MLKHEGRATGAGGAASRRPGADSEYWGGLLKRFSTFERAAEGDLVGELELAAVGHPASDA